jgi:RNA polymerase sigma-70 factor (ECF subfamily)
VNANDIDERLSKIMTLWPVVEKARDGVGATASAAQAQLVQRYLRPIYRYLLAAVRDPDAADELAQEFVVSLLQGAFKRVAPERGRFRDYVKVVLSNAVSRYRQRRAKQPLTAESVVLDGVSAADDNPNLDAAFLKEWREELLARAWEALAKAEKGSGSLYHTLLHFRASNPDVSSAQMAEQFAVKLGRPLSAAGVRQTIHRARELFADLLLDEAATSLETTDLDRVERELIDLELLPYCQDAIQRRRAK